MKAVYTIGMAGLLALSGLASADELIMPVGTPSNASTVSATQYNMVSFTLGSAYEQVDIDASLVTTSTAAPTGTAYLTDMAGPGATAANVLAQTTFNFAVVGNLSAELGWVDLFSGLSLPAGTYFLLFAAPFNGSGAVSISPAMTYTTAPGVTVGAMQFSAGTNQNAAFPPSSTFVNSGLGNRFFRVSGVIPAPGTAALLGMAGVMVLRRRR